MAVLVLGLAIGANTAVFSAAYAFLRKPISLPDIDRVVMALNIHEQAQSSNWEMVSPADYLDWKNDLVSIGQLAAYRWGEVNLTASGAPEKLNGVLTTANFFTAFGERMLLGRAFVQGEDLAGHDQEAVLSYGLWRQHFGADPQILGKVFRLSGKSYTVIGVAKKDFNFPAGVDIWIPLVLTPTDQQDRKNHNLITFGMLNENVSLPAALAEFTAVDNRAKYRYPDEEKGWDVKMIPIRNFVATDLTDRFALLLLGAVTFVLLIACANVANLQFARATSRQKEIAIRSAMGASRMKITRQLLTESVLLSMSACLFGIVFAELGIQLLRFYMPAEISRYISAWQHVRIEPEGLAYTVIIALTAGLLSGLAPSLQLARSGVVETLKESGRSNTAGRRRHMLRNLFVVSEIALSVVLLVGASLMIKGVTSLLAASSVPDAKNILTLRLTLTGDRYAGSRQQSEFYERVLQSLRSVPGVKSIGLATNVPFGDGAVSNTFSIEERSLQPGEFRSATVESVNPEDFQLIGIPLVQGRTIAEGDGLKTPAVAVITNHFAQKYFPGENPVGKKIKLGAESSILPWLTIVGVVGDIRYDPWSRHELPVIYLSYRQAPTPSTYLAIRTTYDPIQLSSAVRSRLAGVDPEQPAYELQTLARVILNQVIELSYVAAMLIVLGAIALVLASVGVYAVMSYSVKERLHEIGIRMALGAQKGDIMYLLLRHGFLLLFIGLGIGLPLSLVIARLLSSLLFGVKATDPAVFVAIALTMCCVGIIACYLPSRRSMNVDPVIALREE
jgi:putative ABC transport system permease protein